MVTVKGYELKNQPGEMKLGEWELLADAVNQKVLDPDDLEGTAGCPTWIRKWWGVLQMQGLPESVLSDMDKNDLEKAASDFNMIDYGAITIVKEIEINGRVYKAFDEGFTIKLPDEEALEEVTKKCKDKKRLWSLWMAVLFKDQQTNKAAHYANAHIEHKAELFREHMQADVAVPYIVHLATKYMNRRKAALEVVRKAREDADTEGLDGGNG